MPHAVDRLARETARVFPLSSTDTRQPPSRARADRAIARTNMSGNMEYSHKETCIQFGDGGGRVRKENAEWGVQRIATKQPAFQLQTCTRTRRRAVWELHCGRYAQGT
jgi:hypothetical protein